MSAPIGNKNAVGNRGNPSPVGVGAPKGNKNAVGNRGGRPPTVKEQIWHKEKWEQDTKVRELEAKIASGEYSVRDVYLLKALKADVVILKNIADKVLATLIDHSTNGKDLPTPIIPLNNVFRNNSNTENSGDEQALEVRPGGNIGE